MSMVSAPSAQRSFRVLALLAVLLTGGAGLVPRDPVPEALVGGSFRLPSFGHVRYWGDQAPTDIVAVLKRNLTGISNLARESPRESGRPVVNSLELSSGGDDGGRLHFGLLVGWTQSGKRPRFEIVTGVKTGALIAPFAFLGPAYDRELEAMWTGHNSTDLILPQPLAVLSAEMRSPTPNPSGGAHYVNRRLLNAIAREYRKGRLLLVGTTNLDAQRPVVWNMGEIALSPHPEAVTLFRQVLLASVSIPVAFPPVHLSGGDRGKNAQ